MACIITAITVPLVLLMNNSKTTTTTTTTTTRTTTTAVPFPRQINGTIRSLKSQRHITCDERNVLKTDNEFGSMAAKAWNWSFSMAFQWPRYAWNWMERRWMGRRKMDFWRRTWLETCFTEIPRNLINHLFVGFSVNFFNKITLIMFSSTLIFCFECLSCSAACSSKFFVNASSLFSSNLTSSSFPTFASFSLCSYAF